MAIVQRDLGTEITYVNAGTGSLVMSFNTEVNGTGVLGSILAGGYYYAATGGTAVDPVYGFQGDADTGLFRQAANVIGVAVGGTEVLRFTGSPASGETVMMVMRDVGGTDLLVNVSVDAVDTAGTGYRGLRIPNSAAA